MQHVAYCLLCISAGINEFVAEACAAAARNARRRMDVADAALARMCEARRTQGR